MKRNTPATVLVLGGGAPHIALCENARARGFRTLLVDFLDNPPARACADAHIQESCLDTNVVADLARANSVTAILTTHSDRALPVAARASELAGLPYYMSHQTAVSITSKDAMKRVFRKAGIPSSSWRIIRRDQLAPQIDLCYPVVCKHVNGTGSAGLFICDHEEAAQLWIEENIGIASAGLLVEEFREGLEYSVDAVVREGTAKVLAARERKKVFFPERGFVLCHGAFLDRNFLAQNVAALEDIAQKVANGFNLYNSPLMIQLILEPAGGFSVIEVAARLSGGITSQYLPKATGVDLLDFSISCQLRQESNVFFEPDDMCYGVQILYGNQGTIAEFTGFEEAKAAGLVDGYHFLRKPGDPVPEGPTTKSRVVEFIVSDREYGGVAAKAHKVFDAIDVIDVGGDSMLIRDPRFSLSA